MRRWAALVAFLALADATAAETLRVRGGEHDGFTRLVVTGIAPGTWTLGRTASGYGLRLDGPAEVDLSQAFRIIGRHRIAELAPDRGGRGLDIALACDCHAAAFETPAGLLVVDIHDGAAPADAGFEASLAASDPALAPLVKPAPGRPQPVDPQIGFYWRRLAARAADAAPAAPEAGRPVTAGAGHTPSAAPAAADGASADASPAAPDAAGAAPAESGLRAMLERAAEQGVVDLDPAQIADAPDSGQPAGPDAPVGAALAATGPIRAETVFDRDAPTVPDTVETAPDSCPAMAEVDLATWADDRPAWLQIVEARSHLLGEFDRPDPESILALGRLYLALGLGDEARATLAGFGPDPAGTPGLWGIALALDDRAQSVDSPLPGWIGCKGAAALWALLVHPDPATADFDVGSVLLAFSALPPGIRLLLGPRLADRFLLRGDPGAARAVRNAMERSANAPAGPSVIAARIDLSVGEGDKGRAALERLAMADSPEAPQALVLAMDRRLADGDPVIPEMVETAAVYAQETRGTPLGAALRRVHILGLAASGEFARAHDELAAADPLPESERAAALSGLLDRLVQDGDDVTFLTQVFALASDLADDPATEALRLRLADRMLDLGLPAAAGALAGPALDSADGSRVAARLALARGDGAGALRALADAEGPEWASLRAQAEAMQGRHDRAAEVLAAAGDSEAAAKEAWRAADWSRVAATGSDAQKASLAALGLVDAAAAAEPAGPLATGRAQIESSRNLREAVASLLSGN